MRIAILLLLVIVIIGMFAVTACTSQESMPADQDGQTEYPDQEQGEAGVEGLQPPAFPEEEA